jgi:hypothetical protein
LQFYVLVGVWALAEGFSGRWKGRWRAVFWLAMAAAALSHLAGLIFMLCLLAAALPARLLWVREEQQGRVDLSRQIRSLWPDGLLAAALLGGMAAITMAGQPAWIEPTSGPSEVTGGISLSALFHVDWMGAVYMAGPILLRLYYVPWTFLLLVNLFGLLYRAISRQLRQVDAILLYLHGTCVLSVLILTVVSPWHLPRYIFPLLPIFFLLGSYEMANIARNLTQVLFRQRSVGSGWLPELTLVLLSLYLWIPLRQLTIGQQYGYDLAFHYVQDRWHEEDAVMAFNTMASYLYLGQCDYYPTQIRPWLLDTPAGQVERYSGAEWIQSVDQLENALARSPRTWYVIDEERFADRVSPEMQRAILDRFQLVSEERGVKIFLYSKQ